MDATVLRRYLQPSSTLRWHPWAPLVAGLLLVLFVFYFGASWGWSASDRQWRSMEGAYGQRVFMDYLGEEKWPGSRVLADAAAIDAVVHRFLEQQAHPLTRWQRLRGRADAYVFAAYTGHLDRRLVVRTAEFRLKELSPANPRWQATSNWCDRNAMPVQEVNVLAAYSQQAIDYSNLLGREVRAQDLAPSVPGWKCEPTVLRKPS
jgi:hypothetical protein